MEGWPGISDGGDQFFVREESLVTEFFLSLQEIQKISKNHK